MTKTNLIFLYHFTRRCQFKEPTTYLENITSALEEIPYKTWLFDQDIYIN